MLLNLHLSRALRAVLVASLAPLAAGAQAPCAPGVANSLAEAWTAYRADALDTAAVRFRRADSLCLRGVEGKLGLGFVRLRQDRAPEADSLFRLVLAHDSAYADGWDGHARSAWRLGDTARAVAAARRALALDPRNADLRAWLDRVALARGLSIYGGGGRVWFSDRNHRTNVGVGVTQSLSKRFFVGAYGRNLAYERRGSGTSRPTGSGCWRGWRGTISTTASGTDGSAASVRSRSGAMAWRRASGTWRRGSGGDGGWAIGSTFSGAATNSAVSSTTGAFHYRTAGVSVRLGL